LLDEILSSNFFQEKLNMGMTAEIDKNKVIVAGHSMGGATAIKVGDSDDRISVVLTHDPYPGIVDEYIDGF